MSQIRKDNKGRKLWVGESQDKTGRYVYKYVDITGKRKAVYSWKLTDSDVIPKGKRQDISLREKEKEIQKNLDDGISSGREMTVLELCQKYLSQKKGLRKKTQNLYNYIINVIKKEKFGSLKIDKVKLSDAKNWFIKMQDDGRGYSTICGVRKIVKPAFQVAVDDDLIRKNPFEFTLATVVVNDSTTREAITKKQERAFLDFVKSDRHFSKYYEGVFILFKTGLRISEFCGLTLEDIDFENKKIKVDHQLLRNDNMKIYVEDTKTQGGVRYIPMSNEVGFCFKHIIENRHKPKIEPLIDGKHGFLYLDRKGTPLVAQHWERYFRNICKTYNLQKRVEHLYVTPHIARHTFCSNMIISGMDPKKMQYIMGHLNVNMTLNTYTHIQYDDISDEMLKICDDVNRDELYDNFYDKRLQSYTK